MKDRTASSNRVATRSGFHPTEPLAFDRAPAPGLLALASDLLSGRWMRFALLRVSVMAILLGALDLAALPAQAACGGKNERACCIGQEQRQNDGRACDVGLRQKSNHQCNAILGYDNCRCPLEAFPAGICVEITDCGGEGERACCIGEREEGFGACMEGLKQIGDCDSELGRENCFCTGGVNARSDGVCRDPMCGGENEPACCIRDGERCEPGPDPGNYPLVGIRGCAEPDGSNCTCLDGEPPLDITIPRTCIQPTECGGPGQRACCAIEPSFVAGNDGCAEGLLAVPGCVGDCWCGSGGIEANFSRFTCSPTSVASDAVEEPEVGWQPHPFGSGRSCPLEGYADIHAHLTSHLAHGGNVNAGAPAPIDADGNFALTPSLNVADALSPQDDFDRHSIHLPLSCPISIVETPDTPQIVINLLSLVSGIICPDDPPTTNQDPVGKGTNDIAFGPNGWPIYNGWPHWRSTTHQQMYYKWLERAWRGGLRLMVQLAVTNEALCRTSDGEDCTDSMKAVDKQIDATYDFQRFVDDLHGGPGMGWFRIVTTPLQARQVIADGKMAVVLGIEMDHLFNCNLREGAPCPGVSHPASVRPCPDGEMCELPPLEPGSTLAETIDWYYEHRGVRHVFPIHNFDNRFGATATWQNAINTGQAVSVGRWQQTRECPPTVGSLPPNESGYAFSMDPLLLAIIGLFGFDEDDLIQAGDPELPAYPETPSCNRSGLTALGIELLDLLTDKGMIIDIDHMSIISFDDTVGFTREKYPETGYPLVASHVQSFDLHRAFIRHERMRTLAQLETIRDSGGMIAAMNKDDVQDTGEKGKDLVVDYVPQLAPAIDNNCRHSSVTYAQAYQYAVDTMGAPVAFGIDFNGVAAHHGPRFGTEACGNFVDPLLDAAFPNLPSVASDEIQSERSQQILYSSKVPYPFTLPGGRWRYGIFDKQESGTRVDDGSGGSIDLRTWDYNVDGLAHAGLLPDLVRDLDIVGLGGPYMDALFNSAEEYIRVWERSESRATGQPIPVRPPELSCSPVALCAGEDTTPPSMTCADVVTECGGTLTTVAFGPEAAGDDCGSVSSACSPASPGTFAIGTSSISCTAADEAGNESECQFALTIEDTTPPFSIVPPDDLAGVECTSPLGASPALGTATASDLCDPDPTISGDAPSVFPFGTTEVLWTATDASGNEASASQSVTVVDTTPPTLTCPEPITLECTSESGAVAEYVATADDVCTETVVPICDPVSGSTFPLGSTVVSCNAADGSGNSSDCDSSVTVVDTTPPQLTLSVSPDTLWPPNHKLVEIASLTTTDDVCDPEPSVVLLNVTMNEGEETLTYDPAFDETIGDGQTSNDIQITEDGRILLRAERSGLGDGRVYTLTYRATDASGNESTATATVTVPRNQ